MNKARGFTLIELLVVIAIIALLMSILMPVLSKAREQGKRVVCMNYLKEICLAWSMYADDNDDKIVNGSAGYNKNLTGTGFGSEQRMWVDALQIYYAQNNHNIQLAEALLKSPQDQTAVGSQVVAGTNLLYRYCKEIKVFACPTAERGQVLSYLVVDAMNGAATWSFAKGAGIGGPAIRHKMEIRRPSDRFVWVDTGRADWDSWTVYYDRPTWWDQPPVRHAKGNNWSFADGHCEFSKWLSYKIVRYGAMDRAAWVALPDSVKFQPCDRDLMWVQRRAWGQLGYDPISDYSCSGKDMGE